jgi:hypothetical protein
MGNRQNDRNYRDAMRAAEKERAAWAMSIESADEADFDYAEALSAVRNQYAN